MPKLFLIGLSAVFGFAPFNHTLIVIVGFAYLYSALEGDKNPAAVGFWFGLGYHIGLLHWLYVPFVLDGSFNKTVAVLAVITASSLLSLTFVFACYFTKKYTLLPAHAAAIFTFSEYLFSDVLCSLACEAGFPWCYAGYTLGSSNILSQSAVLVKTHGLSFFVYYTSFASHKAIISKDLAWLKKIFFVVFSLMTYGVYRMLVAPAFDLDSLGVSIVQPNFNAKHAWTTDELKISVNTLMSMSKSGKTVIWPESSLPHVFSNLPDQVTQYMTEFLEPGQFLITGLTRYNGRFYNSLAVFDHKGRLVESYDKITLVPFGEFTPFRKFLPINALIGEKNEYSKGRSRKVIKLPGIPAFLPLICYEIIFPCLSTGDAKMIINITNDAWFGNTVAPHQHLNISRIRAIESGLPVIRAANTGISAIIDPLGRVIRKIDLNRQGMM